ncbi:MAG TPA: ATP-binding protein [Bdellovibrio sp.]
MSVTQLLMIWFMIAVACCAFLAGASFEYRKQKGVQFYLLIMFLYLGWAFSNLSIILASDLAAKAFFARTRFLFISPTLPLWLYFSYELFARKSPKPLSKYFALTYLPTVFVYIAWAVPSLNSLILKNIEPFNAFGVDVVRWELGPFGKFLFVYSYSCMAVVVYFFTKDYRKQPTYHRFYGLLMMMAMFCYVVPEAIGILFIPEVRFLGMPLLVQIFAAMGFYYVLHRQQVVKSFSATNNILFEFLPTPVVLINRHGRIALFNSKASKLFNLNFSSVGKEIDITLPDQLLDWLKDAPTKNKGHILQLGSGDRTVYHEVVFEEFTHPALDGQGFLLTFNDVTQLKKTTQGNQQLLSLISHDLLGNLTSMSQLAAGKNQEHWDLISDSARSSVDLVKNILLWSSTQGGIYAISKEPVQIADVVNTAKEHIRPFLAEKSIQIQGTALNETAEIAADKKMLLAILRNLLSNAIKYSPNNSIITIDCQRNDQNLHLSVIDQGPGMSPQQAKALLSHYEKSTTPHASSNDGYGIGLFLVIQFLKLHNGYLQIERKENIGFEMRASLPISM